MNKQQPPRASRQAALQGLSASRKAKGIPLPLLFPKKSPRAFFGSPVLRLHSIELLFARRGRTNNNPRATARGDLFLNSVVERPIGFPTSHISLDLYPAREYFPAARPSGCRLRFRPYHIKVHWRVLLLLDFQALKDSHIVYLPIWFRGFHRISGALCHKLFRLLPVVSVYSYLYIGVSRLLFENNFFCKLFSFCTFIIAWNSDLSIVLGKIFWDFSKFFSEGKRAHVCPLFWLLGREAAQGRGAPHALTSSRSLACE